MISTASCIFDCSIACGLLTSEMANGRVHSYCGGIAQLHPQNFNQPLLLAKHVIQVISLLSLSKLILDATLQLYLIFSLTPYALEFPQLFFIVRSLISSTALALWFELFMNAQ